MQAIKPVVKEQIFRSLRAGVVPRIGQQYIQVVLVTGDFDHSVTGEKSQKVTRENDQKSHLTPALLRLGSTRALNTASPTASFGTE